MAIYFNSNPQTLRQKIGMLIFCVPIFAALSYGGFFTQLGLSLRVVFLISGLSGVVGGFLMGTRNSILSAVAGGAGGLLGAYGLSLYLPLRDEIFSSEIVLVFGIASIPAYLTYILLLRFMYPLEEFPFYYVRARK